MDSKLGNVLAMALTMAVAIEQALPQAGLGATKKQIVLNSIETGLKATSSASAALGQSDISLYSGLASAFLDTTIALLNKAGIGPFNKKAVG